MVEQVLQVQPDELLAVSLGLPRHLDCAADTVDNSLGGEIAVGGGVVDAIELVLDGGVNIL